MKILVPLIVLFVTSVFIIELLVYAYKTVRNPHRKIIQRRLKTLSSSEYANDSHDITRKRVLSRVPLLNTILLHTPGVRSLDRLLQQANVQSPLGVFILLAAVLALTGYLAGSLLTINRVIPLIFAASLIVIPFLYVIRKKKKRMDKFQKQLPEGLELIARSLRAGHAFTSGMKLAADEFDDPLGPEFTETLDQINFGVSVSDALKNLAGRVDCPDLRYFVVAVILQRETGGNLAEIIESIGYIIRERFKLKGKIRILAAEGKLSAIILVAIPFFVIIALRFTSPEYINALFFEPAGRIMGAVALVMMVMGIFVMKKVINIKV
jgi:tight adherence protein B